MGSPWEYLADHIRNPARLYSLNIHYLNRSISAPVVGDINGDQWKIFRANLTRVKERIDLSQIQTVMSQGCLLTIWQGYEMSLHSAALTLEFDLEKRAKEDNRKSILTLFLERLEKKRGISRESFRISNWEEIDRIRILRNKVVHDGGILSSKWEALTSVEAGYITPMTDEQRESGDIFGPIEFPEDALDIYSETLAVSIEELGTLLENSPC